MQQRQKRKFSKKTLYHLHCYSDEGLKGNVVNRTWHSKKEGTLEQIYIVSSCSRCFWLFVILFSNPSFFNIISSSHPSPPQYLPSYQIYIELEFSNPSFFNIISSSNPSPPQFLPSYQIYIELEFSNPSFFKIISSSHPSHLQFPPSYQIYFNQLRDSEDFNRWFRI